MQNIRDQIKQLAPWSMSSDELNLLYCYKNGKTLEASLQEIGCSDTVADFVSTIKPDSRVEQEPPLERDDQAYQELHSRISSRSFNSKVAQTLTCVTNALEEKAPFNVSEILKGGSVGKGTAIAGHADAEIVLFVKGLPSTSHARWVPQLVRALGGIVALESGDLFQDVVCNETCVSFTSRGLVSVTVYLSPAFECYKDAIQALSSLDPSSRKYFQPSFGREKTAFVAKQSGQTKVTIRLLKWWREQQSWSCALTKPSDEILEMLAIYSAQHTHPKNQTQAVANCMQLMWRFDELRIVWNNFYKRSDVWSPLLRQKPVVMDPVNPFANLCDPADFDHHECQALAGKTHFFW